MIDFRHHSFLAVCNTLNITKAASLVNLTQPAVTQHIQFLEKEYKCKLFEQKGKQLVKTTKGEILERYVLQMVQNEKIVEQEMTKPEALIPTIRIGATKTIAEYEIPSFVEEKLDSYNFSIQVDNTTNLLHQIDNGELDFALIEGFFDKTLYDTKLYKKDTFSGFCSVDHPFAGKNIPIEQIFDKTVFIRELGSGSRNIFETFLQRNNYSLKNFAKLKTINSVSVTSSLVGRNLGISFGYNSIVKGYPELTTFTINGLPETHEFTVVWMKNSLNPYLDFFLSL